MDRSVPDFASLRGAILFKRHDTHRTCRSFRPLATAAQAQGFYTLKKGKEAWWLRASFNPMNTEIRGIPVKAIRPSWCKATEYTHELLKDLLAQEQAGQTMKEGNLAFAVEGHFDRSQVKQVALVGVYQECGGKKGSFLLIIDEGTQQGPLRQSGTGRGAIRRGRRRQARYRLHILPGVRRFRRAALERKAEDIRVGATRWPELAGMKSERHLLSA